MICDFFKYVYIRDKQLVELDLPSRCFLQTICIFILFDENN